MKRNNTKNYSTLEQANLSDLFIKARRIEDSDATSTTSENTYGSRSNTETTETG